MERTISFLSRILDTLAPRSCVMCDKRLAVSEEVICGHCNLFLPRTGYASSAYDNDEIIDGLLKNSIVISLVETLTYFQKVVADRINDIENGVLKGVNNGSIN